jgi:Zn-dependent metalloprotease
MTAFHVCGIIPPHMLRSIAAHGDGPEREVALRTLDESARVRDERAAARAEARIEVRRRGKRRSVFDARHRHALPGTLVRAEGDEAVDDTAVNEAYEGAGAAYDYFATIHRRSLIDGRGLRLVSTVHYGRHFSNAQWDGRQVIFGDGDGRLFNRFTASLEVIGHELAHGVTQYTAALDYSGQPGALNEHFSDVFGVLIRQWTLRQRARRADWLIGAALLAKHVHGDAVRSMKAPGAAYDDPVLGRDPQPRHMRDYADDPSDHGGVHVNSGIPNHAFYRAAVSLGGFAWETVGRIWYRALTRKLRRDARFADCARATLAAASEIFGARSEPHEAVRHAWQAVGVDAESSAEETPRRRRRRGLSENNAAEPL